MSSRHYTAAPGDPLRLKTRFYLSGVLTDPDSFPSDVGIYMVPAGGSAVATLTPVKESDGIWYIDYTLPADFASAVLYDEWSWIGVTNAPLAVQRYKSEITLTDVPTPPGSFIDSPVDAIGHIFSSVPKSQPPTPKSGFTVKAKPRSVKESIAQHSHDRLKTITKSAIEHYIRSFLDSDGEYRSAIESISKGALQYVTDKSLQATKDPTKRATQLARMFNEVREKTPAILIVDAGMESIPSGLNSGLLASTLINNMWQGWFNKQFKVSLTIIVLTNDQDSTDQLMEIVELLFNNLRQIHDGSEIRSHESGHNWCVRLPLTFSISSTAGANITEDNKDQLWFSEFSLVVESEDTFAIEMPFDTSTTSGAYDRDFRGDYTQEHAADTINNPNLSQSLPPIILAPDTIQINSVAGVSFSRLRPHHKVIIDQPMIATIDVEGRAITPRRLGTFSLQVVDLDTRHDDQGPRAMAPVVVASKTIAVTL